VIVTPLNIERAATPFHYCDSEILVGLQPISPTFSSDPAFLIFSQIVKIEKGLFN